MSQELATVKIFRFDPTTDKSPRYDVFNVPYQGYTALGLVHYIRETFDGSLAYRYGCEGRQANKCCACMVLINGKPSLLCEKIAESEMLIEPNPKFEVIKDLVIDFNKLKQKDRLPQK